MASSVNAVLEDIPDWVKPDIYAKYEGKASGVNYTIIHTITIISVSSSEIIFKDAYTGFGEQEEYTMSYPKGTMFLTQSQIDSVINSPTTFNFLPSSMMASYVKDETITVSSRAFKCVKLKLTYDEGYGDLWVDKISGLIIKDIAVHESGATISSILLETNVPAPQKEGIPGFPMRSIIIGLLLIVLLLMKK
ncbi:hypothetical protein ACFL0D_03575 [Thermoproteota archaeon]